MHKFIDNIVAFSLKNKFFIFFCTVIAVIAGAVSFKHTPIDAFPDVTNTKVTIITQWAGRSAEEVEKFITIPIEIAMNPVHEAGIASNRGSECRGEYVPGSCT